MRQGQNRCGSVPVIFKMTNILDGLMEVLSTGRKYSLTGSINNFCVNI